MEALTNVFSRSKFRNICTWHFWSVVRKYSYTRQRGARKSTISHFLHCIICLVLRLFFLLSGRTCNCITASLKWFCTRTWTCTVYLATNISMSYPSNTGRGSSIGSEFAWHASGPEFDPHIRHILSCKLGHENISTAILPLPLVQEEQLSVTGERMCTKYW